jgi:hypothetical protein
MHITTTSTTFNMPILFLIYLTDDQFASTVCLRFVYRMPPPAVTLWAPKQHSEISPGAPVAMAAEFSSTDLLKLTRPEPEGTVPSDSLLHCETAIGCQQILIFGI